MKTIVLSTVAEKANGYTHMFKIQLADFAGVAATSKVIPLVTLSVGDIVRDAAFYLKEGFVGPAITNATIKVGHNGAAVDDDDSLIAAAELATAGTEILAGDATGAAFAANRTGFAPQEESAIEATFTATGANFSVLTAGEVWVYLNVTRLPGLG